MAGTDDRVKSAVVCESCGEALTAWVWPNGTIQPLGGPNGCPCAEPEFRIMGIDPLSEDDEPSADA